MSTQKQLILADDHSVFCDSFAFYLSRRASELNLSVVGDLDGALALLGTRKILNMATDLLLLDLRMPGMNGLRGLEAVRIAYPGLSIALLSGMAEPADIQTAIRLGATGYFPKTLPAQALLAGIRQVLSGAPYFPHDPATGRLIVSYRADPPPALSATLTPREHQVLGFLADGMSNKVIATRLGLQVVTVKLYVRGVCRKLGAANRTQAALLARRLS